ncbi:chemotaxis protein CheX [Rossellomorea aquimaris]|uniref:chemotaxis protein CheX n=1 Tax=Rossellomorea aquimaris TaxID=189382 RepID=UPI0007D05F79|nr:chemotaxis protein CheX [Rossellomorea aquimaris]
MSLTKSVTDILNSSIQAIKSVIPLSVSVSAPLVLNEPFSQHKIGVLIGMTGDFRGRIIIDGEEESFQGLGASMFGMPLDGAMLESFAGELGNMIAGNLATILAQAGHSVDITPPTVIVGQSKMYGFDKAIKLPIVIENVGGFLVILMIEENIG